MQVNSLIGIKTNQKQGFLQDGRRVPLTSVNVMGNVITQIKKTDKEGYNSLQLGIGINKKAKRQTVNHAKGAGLETTPRFFKEIRVDDTEGASLGQKLNASEVFAPGDIVDVTGISKGKGWAGGVKRWNFKGGPRTHGQSDRERAPGSIGQTTTPGRVYKGKKMAGRMGQDTVTVKNLEVIEVTNDGVLLINGLVPGSLEGLVLIKKMGTNKKFVPLYKEEVEEPVVEEVKEVSSKEPAVEESAEILTASDDAQQVSENQEEGPASLSESQAPVSEETEKAAESLSSDSSESTQVSDAPAEDNKTEEVNKEIKEGEDK
ncbi:MAG TPA: 50S ribosomal protein L3 [Candidatus Sulfotelmatobacter sp.]|nr:50S ribosomal protein L3 [Candidatus Sulfotelmatobacter sp.]